MSALLLQALGVVCPTCDQFNPPGAQKCTDCGTPLGAGAPAPAASAPGAAAKPAAVPSPAQVPVGQRQTSPGTPAPTPPPHHTPSQPGAAVAMSSPLPGPSPLKPASPTPGAPPSLGPEPRTDAAFPPGMRPAARGPRPQLTAAPPEPIGIRETTPGSVSTVVPSAPTPLGTPAISAAPAPQPQRGPAASQPIPASELLKPKAPPTAPPGVAAARPGAAAPSRYGISVLSGQNAGQRFRLGGAGCMVGRSKGAILFTDDPFVSAHHGTLILRDGKLFIRDEASLSGIFVSLSGGQEAIGVGGFFAAGQRLFRFAGPLPPPPAPVPGRPLTYGAPVPQSQTLYALEEVIVGGRAGRAVVTGGPLLTIGQHHCDLSFPGDESLAARHCELSPAGPSATLRDLSGGLGTYVRITSGAERVLNAGDRVRIGQQVLQVEAVA